MLNNHSQTDTMIIQDFNITKRKNISACLLFSKIIKQKGKFNTTSTTRKFNEAILWRMILHKSQRNIFET